MEWTNGGPKALIARIEAIPAELRKDIHTELQDTVAEAAANQKLLIEQAVTETGRHREASGRGVPGRVETGLMINSITASATEDTLTGTSIEGTEIDAGGTIIGTWGWEDPEAYFSYQDNGTKQIAPALSLLTSFLVAKTRFQSRLREIIQARFGQ